jgi:hypothetical protein
MNRISDNDKTWGPFTLARWKKTISLELSSGDDEDSENFLLFVAFGWALRIELPHVLNSFRERHGEHRVVYGFSLSDMGAGYDFFQLKFGPQTWDSSTTKSWSKHLPWMMWDSVRTSIYSPDGAHFATQEKGKWDAFYKLKEQCPKLHFGFEDYDGELITATCMIEEMEWHRGEGWFKWLKWFYPAKIRRSLDLKFSTEVGPEKGSWKGGTIGHGIDMLEGETPRQAFERYCAKDHERKGRSFVLKFIGPCSPPSEK